MPDPAGANGAPIEWGQRYLPREIAQVMYEAGTIDVVLLHMFVWIVQLESNGYEKRQHQNDDGSIDRGAYMINDRAHPEIPDSVAYDFNLATDAARKIWIANHKSFATWSSYLKVQTVQVRGINGNPDAVRMCLYAADGVGGNMIKAQYGLLA